MWCWSSAPGFLDRHRGCWRAANRRHSASSHYSTAELLVRRFLAARGRAMIQLVRTPTTSCPNTACRAGELARPSMIGDRLFMYKFRRLATEPHVERPEIVEQPEIHVLAAQPFFQGSSKPQGVATDPAQG